ncbi:N-6 DNA methylase [Coprococcus comes]|uniref:N-6 DNA methylase n=1 Tax=Coprococcus comes TaxID=410072 RepID=UPI00156E0E9A|nr:N-6 DNA methylase [Coprococcus comes]NSE82438.1 N-6 DNA methylase [Coprococcus comes]NSE85309.1 N-6 DNA methylase [Coprococcus comes]NSF21793.1 N-6 DNA methylase [Coprococcus comes]
MKSVYIKNMLGTLGYSNEHFSENYSVQIDGTSAIRFDYVAFSDRYLKDVSTSCIAVQEVIDDNEETKYLDGAKYLATPIVIISKNRHVRVWNIAPQKITLLNDNEENIIHLYFEKNRFEFMSDNLIDAKMGYRQINIFEASGLIDFSRKATCKILSEEFEKGLIAAKKYLKKRKNINGQDLNNITSITMHVISALIINSKIKPDEKVPDLFELLTDLSQTYKDYFSDKLMFKYGKGLLIEIYNDLNRSINYQSVDHELLGYFYESTLLQLSETKAETIRKEFGIYYTPRILSQEIVWSIPFESIPVDERYVLDGTCGSGSLLLSACKRLEELVSYEKTEIDRHNYLTRMIEGYDIDKFASEVARLSLLLYSLPYGNKWNIHAGDLLRINKSKIQVPFVILGNPPYEEVRGNSQKKQKAAAFLDKYLEWLHDDGFIGIILPESFLQNDSSVSQREKLLNEFDIIELWMLPGQIFENNCSTIVIIARKKKVEDEKLTKIKVLVRNKESIRSYFKQRKWDFEFFVNIQKRWKNEPKYKISVSPVEDILQKIIKGKKTIGDITQNVMGIMFPSNYNFSRMQFDGWIPYIANANNFRKYVISPQMRDNVCFFDYHMSEEEEKKIKKDYKGLRLRRDYESIYAASNKILVKMSSTPGEINCINALVDEDGYYPSHSFFVLISEDKKVSNYVLCALINSKLINAYVRRECVKRTLTTNVVRSIPVPEFSDVQISKIEQCYMSIKEACTSEDKEKVEKIQKTIDDIIFEAFNLEQGEKEKIEKLFEVYTRDGDNLTSANVELKEYHNVSGEVEEIDIEKMYCTVYLAEFGEQEIKIEKSMPGWFLRRGTEFSAKYHEGKLFDIKPLMYSYLDDEEIIELLSKKISE